MCDKSQDIATVIKSLIECVPHGDDTVPLQRLYKNVFYKAPEVCDQYWQDLYSVLVRKYDGQSAMCDIYNDGYNSYQIKFNV